MKLILFIFIFLILSLVKGLVKLLNAGNETWQETKKIGKQILTSMEDDKAIYASYKQADVIASLYLKPLIDNLVQIHSQENMPVIFKDPYILGILYELIGISCRVHGVDGRYITPNLMLIDLLPRLVEGLNKDELYSIVRSYDFITKETEIFEQGKKEGNKYLTIIFDLECSLRSEEIVEIQNEIQAFVDMNRVLLGQECNMSEAVIHIIFDRIQARATNIINEVNSDK